MTRCRLSEKFTGFDSIDEKMKRVPNDLNDPNLRKEYVRNHVEWFLKNHPDAVEDFLQEVQEKYKSKTVRYKQLSFSDSGREQHSASL